MYSSGVWTVKKGHEEDFARIWQTIADQTSLEFPGVTFRLLQDVEKPARFVAFSGPWRSAEQIATARALPVFQEGLTRMNAIVESAQLSILELAAEVS